MKPYYENEGIALFHGDCQEILPQVRSKKDLIVTDPPFNIGYHYGSYTDDLSKDAYLSLLKAVLLLPCVVIHFPEAMFSVSLAIKKIPEKCVAWVYNANTPRQWRMISYFGTKPDFNLLKQPYKNLNDSRIQARLEKDFSGGGAAL